jgi:hypothetical protein
MPKASDQQLAKPNDVNEIQSPVDIDDMLIRIAALDDQIEHYKALKRRRTAVIDEEIVRLEDAQQEYREAITSFMAANDEKSLNFPGVGKVNRKTAAGKWIVLDEEALLAYLQKKMPQALDAVVQMVPKIKKKELNKLLDSVGEIDGVEQEPARDSLSITFDKSDRSLIGKVKDLRNVMLSDQTPEAPAQDFDALEI